MLSKPLKARLRKLIKSDEWDGFVAYYGKVVDKWSGGTVIGKNSYETLKNAIWKEAKLEAIREFTEGLEKEAFNDND